MIGVGLYAGERPSALHWFGLLIAVAGLIYLVSPGIAAPSAVGALLMGIAGVAWGVYSILGRGVINPVHATAKNFLRTVPLTLVVFILWLPSLAISAEGFLWAALSDSMTSAVGYVIWYAALRGLTATLAATRATLGAGARCARRRCIPVGTNYLALDSGGLVDTRRRGPGDLQSEKVISWYDLSPRRCLDD